MAAATILIAGAIFHSCQKETMQPVKEQGTMVVKDVPNPGVMPLCDEGCLEDGPFYLITTSFTRQWGPLAQFPGYYKNNKKIVVSTWNDAEYFYVQTNVFGYQYDQKKVDGIWTLLDPTYNNYPFETVIITLNGTVYTYSMDNSETPDIVETATEYIQAFPLPEGWEACTEMVYTVRAEGDGQPVWLGTASTPAFFTYELYDYCSCENWQTETAFGGETEGGGNAWWFYYDGVGAEIIWAGQTIEVGTVEFVNGELVITLTGGWELQDVWDAVKVFGYNENPPAVKPNPGQNQNDLLYQSNSLNIEDIFGYDYYVIHLDVRKCID